MTERKVAWQDRERRGREREEIESGRKDRGGEGETEKKNRRDEWEKRRGERRASGGRHIQGEPARWIRGNRLSSCVEYTL